VRRRPARFKAFVPESLADGLMIAETDCKLERLPEAGSTSFRPRNANRQRDASSGILPKS
jgi:hypothetical protein